MNTKRQFLVLTDYSWKAQKQDVFQNQLHRALLYVGIRRSDYHFINIGKRESYNYLNNLQGLFPRKKPKKVLLIGRTRVFFRYSREIQRICENAEVAIYDQDPWESYIHNSPSRGFFRNLESIVNLKEVFLTSDFWTSIVQDDLKAKVSFVRMGIEPKLIPREIPIIDSRLRDLAFIGSLKEHRLEGLEKAKSTGLNIEISRSKFSHPDYLKYLRNLKIFFHDEGGYWYCPDLKDGNQRVPRVTGMWAKDLEIASQGAFVIRNFGTDALTYGLEKIPLIRFYKNLDDFYSLATSVLSLSASEKLEIQEASIAEIRSRNDWVSIAEKLTR